MSIEHVAVVGRGAVGLLYGGMIAEGVGLDAVEFVMDDERFSRHAGETVTVNGEPCRVRTVPASEAEPVDLIIVATKAYGLDVALDTMERLVGPETRIISLLNGITSEERIAARFGWEHTVLAVAQGMDAVFVGGALTYTHTGEIRLGPAERTAPGVAEDIADLLERAHITHVVETDIRRRMWVKLMLNVGINQTCMAYGGSYGTASEPGSEQNRCFVAAMREALAVARAEGVDVREADLAQMAELIASLDYDGLPSMAQDRVNGKPTEVVEFSGTIIRLAERHGILVPTNRWLYARICELEASYGAGAA